MQWIISNRNKKDICLVLLLINESVGGQIITLLNQSQLFGWSQVLEILLEILKWSCVLTSIFLGFVTISLTLFRLQYNYMFYISLDCITYDKHQEWWYNKTTGGRHSFNSQIIWHYTIILQNITCITQHSHSLCNKALTALVRLTSSTLFLFILLLYYNDEFGIRLFLSIYIKR